MLRYVPRGSKAVYQGTILHLSSARQNPWFQRIRQRMGFRTAARLERLHPFVAPPLQWRGRSKQASLWFHFGRLCFAYTTSRMPCRSHAAQLRAAHPDSSTVRPAPILEFHVESSQVHLRTARRPFRQDAL